MTYLSKLKYLGEEVDADFIYNCVGKGWHPLLDELFKRLFELGWDGDIHQLKEKLGGLRVYFGEASEEMYGLAWEAEKQSMNICEACGKPGRTSGWGGYWIKTLCEEHGELYRKKELKM